jgi:hypothetical protein
MCVALALACVLVSPDGHAAAQESTADSGESVLDAVELPVSLERIKRRLDKLPETEESRSLLRLNYYIDVYGRAPKINVFEDFDLHTGPIPYGVPSHYELLSAATPPQWRQKGSVTFSR